MRCPQLRTLQPTDVAQVPVQQGSALVAVYVVKGFRVRGFRGLKFIELQSPFIR